PSCRRVWQKPQNFWTRSLINIEPSCAWKAKGGSLRSTGGYRSGFKARLHGVRNFFQRAKEGVIIARRYFVLRAPITKGTGGIAPLGRRVRRPRKPLLKKNRRAEEETRSSLGQPHRHLPQILHHPRSRRLPRRLVRHAEDRGRVDRCREPRRPRRLEELPV